MATSFKPVKGRAYSFSVGLVDAAAVTKLKAAPTLAAGDFQISIDGGAFSNLATLPTVTPAGGRAVKFSLSAAEMTGDNIVVQAVDAAGAEWCDAMWSIETKDPSMAAMQISMRLLGSGAPALGKTVAVKYRADIAAPVVIGTATELGDGLYYFPVSLAVANSYIDSLSFIATNAECITELVTWNPVY